MASSTSKKRRGQQGEGPPDEDASTTIATLQAQVASLKEQLAKQSSYQLTAYAAPFAAADPIHMAHMPQNSHNPRHVKEMISSIHDLDNQPRLNTSSVGNDTGWIIT